MADFSFPTDLRIPQKLVSSADAYVHARNAADAHARQNSLVSFINGFHGLHGRRLSNDIGNVIMSMDDLTDGELSVLSTWMSADAELYLRLCTHPGATSKVRFVLLSLTVHGKASRRPTIGRQLREKYLHDHPLVLRVFDTQPHDVLGIGPRWPYSHLIDTAEPAVVAEPRLLDVCAALIPTWTGDGNALLGAARGIFAAT